MIRSIFVLSVLLAACGAPPCKDYCTTACNKYVACGVSKGNGPKMTASEVPGCADACFTAIQAAHVSDDQCNTDIETVDNESCGQFVDALNHQ